MNAYEKEQVEAIIFGAWKTISGIHNDIPWQGASIAGQLVDFRGDLPPPSNFKVESVSVKAEKLSKYAITDFDKYSAELMSWFKITEYYLLVAPNLYVTITQKNPTGLEVAKYLDMDYENYRAKKARLFASISRIDKLIRPDAYKKQKSA